MVMRVGGLASGMDIDALVEKLMKAERAPLDKTFQKKQTYEWQRDAYRSVNAQTKKFEDYLMANTWKPSDMMTKNATSSNDGLVSAKATGAATGSLTIESVSQLATSAQKIGEQTQYSGSTRLADMGITGNSIEIQAIDKDGRLAEKATTISFDPNKDTVTDLVDKINKSDAGVTALFENGKMSITAKNTGSEKGGQGEIVFAGGQEVFDKLGFSSTSAVTEKAGQNAIFKVNGISTERSSNSFTISGYEMTLKETFNAKAGAQEQLTIAQNELQNAQNAIPGLTQKLDDARNAFQTSSDAYKAAHESVFGKNTLTEEQQKVYNKISSNANISALSNDDLNALKGLTIDFTDKNTIAESIKNSSLSDEQKATIGKLSSNDLKTLQSDDGEAILERTKQIELEKSYNALDDKFLADINDDDITFLNSIKGKSNEDIKAAIEALEDGDQKTKFSKIDVGDLGKLASVESYIKDFQSFKDVDKDFKAKDKALKGATSDAEAGEQRLKDAQQSLKNAEQAVNNMAGSNAPTVSVVSLNAATDTKELKTKIQDFVKNYNEMLENLNGLLKEKKHRDFAPLTKQQREDMSENEQKLWDEKAKSGLLRNDSTVRDGLAKMRMQFMSPVAGLGDKTMDALAEIGITTSSKMTEGGKLVIDEKKLDEALAKDPDQVVKMFTQTGSVETKTVDGRRVTEDSRGITQRLRDEIKNLTQTIEKKAGKDGQVDQSYGIGKKIVQQDDKMKNLERKLQAIEARYWQQFTAMEKAINKANEQSGMFAQFGGQ